MLNQISKQQIIAKLTTVRLKEKLNQFALQEFLKDLKVSIKLKAKANKRVTILRI